MALIEASIWPDGLAALVAPADALTVSDYLADGRAIPSIQDSADYLLGQEDLTEADLADGDLAEAQGQTTLQALFDRLGIKERRPTPVCTGNRVCPT